MILQRAWLAPSRDIVQKPLNVAKPLDLPGWLAVVCPALDVLQQILDLRIEFQQLGRLFEPFRRRAESSAGVRM